MYNFWKANSEVSVHRSNNRHIVKVSPKNLKKQVVDLEDDWISDITTKRGDKKKAHKCITSEPYHILHRIYCNTHEFKPSYGLFLNLKPFYLSTPSEKEVELCMCSSCLNPHCLYKAIKNNVEKEMPYSLMEYLSKGIKCQKEPDIDFVAIECIQGKCKNGCKPLNVADDLSEELDISRKRIVTYYVFERVKNPIL